MSRDVARADAVRERTHEIWVTPDGYIRYQIWNACRCHPNEVVVESRTNGKETYCYAMNRGESTRGLNRRGFVRLEVWRD